MGIYHQPYKVWEFDLKIARQDERLGLAGTDLIVFKCSNPIELKLDDLRNDRITVSACDQTSPVYITGIPFRDIWMTNEATGGIVQFIVLFSGTTTQLIEEIKKPRGIELLLDKLGIK